MSNIEIACTVCSVGGMVGVIAFMFLQFADVGRLRWWAYVLAFLLFAGFGAWAAEDRVCEVAERQAKP
jgi:hypothetical protein